MKNKKVYIINVISSNFDMNYVSYIIPNINPITGHNQIYGFEESKNILDIHKTCIFDSIYKCRDIVISLRNAFPTLIFNMIPIDESLINGNNLEVNKKMYVIKINDRFYVEDIQIYKGIITRISYTENINNIKDICKYDNDKCQDIINMIRNNILNVNIIQSVPISDNDNNKANSNTIEIAEKIINKLNDIKEEYIIIDNLIFNKEGVKFYKAISTAISILNDRIETEKFIKEEGE